MPDQDLEFILEANEENTEITITLKSPVPMTTEDVILELEYYINEVSRAEDYLSKPHAHKH